MGRPESRRGRQPQRMHQHDHSLRGSVELRKSVYVSRPLTVSQRRHEPVAAQHVTAASRRVRLIVWPSPSSLRIRSAHRC